MTTRTDLPDNAVCRWTAADGRVLTITASRRPRAQRADVKCAVPGAPAIAARMQEVLRLARLTEAVSDSRDQVVLSIDGAPPAGQRGWELAAVLADRSVRGLWQAPRAPLHAHGWSDAWHLGRVDGDANINIADADAFVVTGGADGDSGANGLALRHLGGLTGHADPSSAVSSARAWFPLHSGGINDSLAWVEVSVYPLAPESAPLDEEDTIAAPGLDLAAQLDVRRALSGARHFDGRGLGRWRTVVRFGQPRFQGESYQLALVMADRLARGREFVPRGRLIASGWSNAWHAGAVQTVEGREAKMELILKQACNGDRVLLPLDWQAALDAPWRAALAGKGASVACIDRIGII